MLEASYRPLVNYIFSLLLTSFNYYMGSNLLDFSSTGLRIHPTPFLAKEFNQYGPKGANSGPNQKTMKLGIHYFFSEKGCLEPIFYENLALVSMKINMRMVL